MIRVKYWEVTADIGNEVSIRVEKTAASYTNKSRSSLDILCKYPWMRLDGSPCCVPCLLAALHHILTFQNSTKI